MSVLSIIGVPSSAGSYAAGQDQAPRVLRESGLVDALTDRGWQVEDAGDLAEQIWAPDRAHPLAQNAGQVVESLTALAQRVPDLLSDDRRLLVLGGNCTVALGVIAGMQAQLGEDCGLLYLDRHLDMNTPETTLDGALDWMGLAHALDLPGCVDELAGAFDRRPLLDPADLVLLGIDPSEATDFELARSAELEISITTQEALAADPIGAARTALGALPAGPFAVHIDVDVLDFIDAPLAENTSSRNVGPSLDQAGRALQTIISDPRWRALTIGELNPTRSAGQPDTLPRFVNTIADALAGALAR